MELFLPAGAGGLPSPQSDAGIIEDNHISSPRPFLQEQLKMGDPLPEFQEPVHSSGD